MGGFRAKQLGKYVYSVNQSSISIDHAVPGPVLSIGIQQGTKQPSSGQQADLKKSKEN